MVDTRPLLFVNALGLMLLITAGFSHIRTTGNLTGSAQITATVNTANTKKQIANPPRIQKTSPLAKNKIIKATPVPSKIKQTLVSLPHQSNKRHIKKISSSKKTISSPVKLVPKPRLTSVHIKKQVKPKIKHRSKPKIKPVTTIGRLIIRSNLSRDTVLINGIPRGTTRLDIKLKQGIYEIEVAKSGYTSWRKEIAIVPGKRLTLMAKLKKPTKVEYIDGTWLNGVVTGEGTYHDKKGTVYQGAFVGGKFHGAGSIRYANGTRYEGDWFENKMQGDGTLTTLKGDTYTGQFKDGQFNGDGTLTKSNGDIYTGHWSNGTLNGQGSLTTTKGLLYVGGFSNNQFQGQGSITYPDGRHYEGSFNQGKFQGKGILTYSNGQKYSGQFMAGKYYGAGELLNPNGGKITATFKDGKPFGQVRLTTPQGEVFTARTEQPGVCYRLKSYRATQCPPMTGW